jgi:hypothetical protein
MDNLIALFPDFDKQVIQDIYDSQNQDVDATAVILLEMQHPQETKKSLSFQDEAKSAKLAQELSDEELARELQEAENRRIEDQVDEQMNSDQGSSTLDSLKEKMSKGAVAISEGIKNTFKKWNTSKQDPQYSHLLKEDFDSLN